MVRRREVCLFLVSHSIMLVGVRQLRCGSIAAFSSAVQATLPILPGGNGKVWIASLAILSIPDFHSLVLCLVLFGEGGHRNINTRYRFGQLAFRNSLR